MTRRSTVEQLVADELWELVEPLIPGSHAAGGRADGASTVAGPGAVRRCPARARQGIGWNDPPAELYALVMGANTHDSRMFTKLLDTNHGVLERSGQPAGLRRRPQKLHADKGYDYPHCRRMEDCASLRRHWGVERTGAWMSSVRRPVLRYERSRTSTEAPPGSNRPTPPLDTLVMLRVDRIGERLAEPFVAGMPPTFSGVHTPHQPRSAGTLRRPAAQ